MRVGSQVEDGVSVEVASEVGSWVEDGVSVEVWLGVSVEVASEVGVWVGSCVGSLVGALVGKLIVAFFARSASQHSDPVYDDKMLPQVTFTVSNIAALVISCEQQEFS